MIFDPIALIFIVEWPFQLGFVIHSAGITCCYLVGWLDSTVEITSGVQEGDQGN